MKTGQRPLVLLLTVLLLLAAFPGFAGAAAEGTCGETLYWSLHPETGALTIDGTGSMSDFASASKAPWYASRRSVKSIVCSAGVTGLGDYAFSGCTALAAATLPATLTRIGENAFNGCSALSALTLPDTLSEIGKNAFFGCTNIQSFTVGDGNTAFASADGILFNKTKTTLLYYPAAKAATGCTLPAGVTAVSAYAFKDADKLQTITLPASMESIGSYAFSFCNALQSVALPDGITTVEAGLFSGCTALTEVTLPASLLSVGDSAFGNCMALTAISLPDGVTAIGSKAFRYCGALQSVVLPDSIEAIGSEAFAGCRSLFAFTLPDKLTSIGDNAFADCCGLAELCNRSDLVLAMGTTANGGIAYYARNIYTDTNGASALFTGTDGIYLLADTAALLRYTGSAQDLSMAAEVSFNGSPHAVGEILPYAFFGSDTLTTLRLPAGLLSVGENAFAGSTALRSLYVAGTATVLDGSGFGLTAAGAALADATLYGYAGSTADTYAHQYGVRICAADTGEALGTTGDDWIIDPATTCTGGQPGQLCPFCGRIHYAEAGGTVPHTASDWCIDTPATCTAAGSMHTECTGCGVVLETQAIPQLSHSDANGDGRCDACDTYMSEPSFIYRIKAFFAGILETLKSLFGG